MKFISTSDLVYFAAKTITVTEALKAGKMNPEWVAVGKVSSVAVEALGIGGMQQ